MCVIARSADAEMEPESGLSLPQMLFLQTTLAGKRQEALTIVLEALRAGQAVVDLYVDIIQTSLYQIGLLWERNQITVAEEHMATAIVQYVMAQLYAHLPPATITRGNVVITGIQGELHQVGANLVADVLEADGWDVRFLARIRRRQTFSRPSTHITRPFWAFPLPCSLACRRCRG
jgi:methanogenic corrinoid protein MtbC1